MTVSAETRVEKGRVVVIPKRVAEAANIDVGQKVRIRAEGDRIVIEPIRDAMWLALHGEKIGKILPEELEEESVSEQAKLDDE